jgi:hypothetical protein
MPSQASNVTSLRAGAYALRAYLSDLSGTQVLEAEVTSVDSLTVKSLGISITTGDIADVQRGYRVMVYSASDVFKGMIWVRAAGTLDATHLPIREIGFGTIFFTVGDIVRVFNDVVLGDKLPEDTEDFDPDGLAVSDNTSDPAPVVVSGGHWAGWLPTSGSLALVFKGDESYTIDPDSSGTITHAWTASSGTWDDDTAANPTLTIAAAGKILVTHTVTDSTNSKTRTQYVRVRVHDANDPPIDCLIETLDADEEQGWSATVEVFGDSLTTADLHDGAMVCLWARDTISGVEPTFGTPVSQRGHILLVGFLRRDTNKAHLRHPTMRFDIISPLARLAEMPGFSKVLERNQTPDAWSEVKSLTMKRAIVQLVAYYTWLIEAGFDFVFDSSYIDADYPLLFCQKDNPLGQLRELASGRLARIVCMKDGRIEVQERLAVADVADRAAITKTLTITPADVDAGEEGDDGIEFTREHHDPLEHYRTRGFIGTTDTQTTLPMFFRFPASPGTGNTTEVRERLVFADIIEALQWTAALGAEYNRVYMPDGTRKLHAPHIDSARFRGGYWRIWDFYREYQAFSSYDGTTNLRGVDLTAFLWELKSLSVEFTENGVPITTPQMQAETFAPYSTAYPDFPESGDTSDEDDVDIEAPPITTLPDFGDSGLTPAARDLVAFCANGDVYVTNTGGLTWELLYNLFTDLLLAGAVCLGATWRVGGGIARILTDEGVSRVSNFATSSPTVVNEHTFPETSQNRQFNFERSLPDWGIVASYIVGTGVRVDWTTDDTTWTRETITNHYDTNATNGPRPGVWVDPHIPGHAYISAFTATGNGASLSSAGYETSDYGDTWALASNPSIDANDWLANMIVVPFTNVGGTVIYHGFNTAGANQIFDLYKTTTGGATKISPTHSGTEYGYVQGYRCTAIADDDANSVIAIAASESNLSTIGVWLSRDGGDNWTLLLTPSSDMPYRQCYFVARNAAYFIGTGGSIGYFDGNTIFDLSVDTASEIVAIMGP